MEKPHAPALLLRITEPGRRVLADQREDWSRFVAALGQVAGVMQRGVV